MNKTPNETPTVKAHGLPSQAAVGRLEQVSSLLKTWTVTSSEQAGPLPSSY